MGCCKSRKYYPNENWMGDLPEETRDFSVINLAIPGSHDSMAYGINRLSEPSLDAEDEVRRVYKFCPCFIRKWLITQSVDVIEQLKLGVRYFDLRISLKDDTKFYFAHGLYAMEIFKPLKDIKLFLDKHPREIVILDFQHFYGLKDLHHRQLQSYINGIFTPIIYTPDDGPLIDATLKNFESKRKQVLIIYRQYHKRLAKFWADEYWPTPWPNTTDITDLINYLDHMLKYRNPYCGYVSQCVLTPNAKYIVSKFYSSLKGTSLKAHKKIIGWIEKQRPGKFVVFTSKATVNVFIADFVHVYDGDFCKKVIGLNNNLIQI